MCSSLRRCFLFCTFAALAAAAPSSAAVPRQCGAAPAMSGSRQNVSLTGVFIPSTSCDAYCGNVSAEAMAAGAGCSAGSLSIASLSDCTAGCVLCADGSVLGLYDVASCEPPPGAAHALVTVAGNGRFKCGLPQLDVCYSTVVVSPAPPGSGLVTPSPPPPRGYWDGTALLNGRVMSVSWKLRASDGTVTFSVAALAPSSAASLGLGTRMVGSTAYVAYFDDQNVGHVDSYWMTGEVASGVVVTGEVLTDVAVARSPAGMISFNFTRSLTPASPWPVAGAPPPGAINPSAATFVYALFPSWRSVPLPSNEHNLRSRGYTSVDLTLGGDGGAAEVSAPVPKAVVIHSVLMALAWGILFPGGIAASRFVKSLVPGPLFFKLHMGANAVGSLFVLIAFVVIYRSVGSNGGEHYAGGSHTRLGLALFILAFFQPANGFVRPPKEKVDGQQPPPARDKTGAAQLWATQQQPSLRAIWESIHKNFGRALVVISAVTVYTGIGEAADSGAGPRSVAAGRALWVLWCLACAAAAAAVELRIRRRAAGGVAPADAAAEVGQHAELLPVAAKG